MKKDLAIEDIQVSKDRVLVKIWKDQEMADKEEVLSKIVLTDQQKNDALNDVAKGKANSKTLMKCEIVNVGPDVTPGMNYKAGDIVYVFPNTFEGDIAVDDIQCLIYAERNILIKINKKN